MKWMQKLNGNSHNNNLSFNEVGSCRVRDGSSINSYNIFKLKNLTLICKEMKIFKYDYILNKS